MTYERSRQRRICARDQRSDTGTGTRMGEYRRVYTLARLYGWRPSCTESEIEPYLCARPWLALKGQLDATLERDVLAFADALERALADIPDDDPMSFQVEKGS